MRTFANRRKLSPGHAFSHVWRREIAGFTLIELMTVVTIFGVLAMIAVPSFSTLIASQQADSTGTDLYVAMARTRSEATKRNVDIWLCPKTAGASGWKDGWRIQASDCSSLAGTAVADHAPVIKSTISGPASVQYQTSGRVQGATAPAFTVTATTGLSSATKYVCVDLGGRPVVQASVCS